MAIEPPAPRRHKKDRSSIAGKNSDHRSSIGSKPLSFHQKKGKFAGGIGHGPKSEHLDRLRKDALEDFTRATHSRSQSVHQIAAMYASASSDRAVFSDGKKLQHQRVALDGWLPEAIRSGSGANSKDCGELASAFPSGGGGRTLESLTLEAQDRSFEEPHVHVGDGTQQLPSQRQSLFQRQFPEPVHLNKYTSTSDVRARDLKKIHLDEALNVTSHLARKVKDIASGFQGESRPENVEVFHERHKKQEADYRQKVHQGKETLMKTSQSTDAMYNFVLKLNLATSEGKQRFMRRWAIGRIANGESVNPTEGWKFLQSLGIGVQKPQKPAAAATCASRAAPAEQDNAMQSGGHDKTIPTATPTASRGRAGTKTAPPTAGRYGGGGGAFSVEDGSKNDSAAWEVAMSQAVGAVARVDADALAPKLGLQRRRRSGSEPRRTPSNLPRAPETCRAPKTKSFFFGSGGGSDAKATPPPPPAAGSGKFGLLEDEDDDEQGSLRGFGRDSLSLSPAGSTGGLDIDGRRPQSQAFGNRGPSLDSLRASVSSSRTSFPPGPDMSPTRSERGVVRISLSPCDGSPGRFILSPGRRSTRRSPLTPSANAAAASMLRLSWGCAGTSPPRGGLQLPQRLVAGDENAEEGVDDNDGRRGSYSGSEERFDGSPAQGLGEGGGALSLPAARGPFEGGWEDAGNMAVHIVSKEEEEEEEHQQERARQASAASSDYHEARGLSVATSDFHEARRLSGASSDFHEARCASVAGRDDFKARADRLSAVSTIVGPGTLSDDEEEDAEAVTTRSGSSQACSPSVECPVSPEEGAVVATEAVATQEKVGLKEVDMPVSVDIVADDAASGMSRSTATGSESGRAEISAVMDDIASMGEQIVLAEAEAALAAAGIAGGDGGGVESVSAAPSSSLGESERGTGAETNGGSLVDVEDVAVSAVAAAAAAIAADREEILLALRNAIDGYDETAADEDEDEEEPASSDMTPAAAVTTTGGGRHGLAPVVACDGSGGDDDGDDFDGRTFSSGEGGSEGKEAPSEAIPVDRAVRETLDNLTAGVAILVGGEDDAFDAFLGCSEVLSELQSDAGGENTEDEAAVEIGSATEQKSGPNESAVEVNEGGVEVLENAPSPVQGREGELLRNGSHKSLKIAVGSELHEEEPPVPRLYWGVNHIPVDSPLTPSRYDDEQAPSTSLPSPLRMVVTGLPEEESPEGAEPADVHGVNALTSDHEDEGLFDDTCMHSDDGSDEEIDLFAGTQLPSPFSGSCSPDALEALEQVKGDKWRGRLSVLSEGGESRLSHDSRSSSGSAAVADGNDGDGETFFPKDVRRMTEGTQDTAASPSSQRLSTESSALTPSATAAACLAGNGPGVSRNDGVDGDGRSLVPPKDPTESESGHDGRSNGDEEGPALPPSAKLRAAPEAALDTPLPGTPDGSSPGGQHNASPAAYTSSTMESSRNLGEIPFDQSEGSTDVSKGEPEGADGVGTEGGDRENGGDLLVWSGEVQEPLRLDISNPYEDFDGLHDRDHKTPPTVELDCRTPADIFNFCRPRTGILYGSASGPPPGFFKEDQAEVVGGGVGPSNESTGGCAIS